MDHRFRINDIPFKDVQWLAEAMRADAMVNSVSTPVGLTSDSRLVQPGDLFIPLVGHQQDGHRYIAQAFEKGAVCVACNRSQVKSLKEHSNLLVVEDTKKSLGYLAQAWIRQFDVPRIALTGSNGKTTTKNMIDSILSVSNNPLVTLGNWNNDIGLPFTCLMLREHHSHLVTEMGMNHFNEIAWLTEIVQPDIGLITNVMPVHLEGVGDIAGVAKAKGELWENMPTQSKAIVNLDYPQLKKLCEAYDHPKVTYSVRNSEADIYLRSVKASELTRASGCMAYGNQDINFELAMPGSHNIENALASAAVAKALDLPASEVASGLERTASDNMRNQIKTVGENVTLYVDCYNANPGSMAAGLQAASSLPAKRHLAALGDMGELGSEALSGHIDTLQAAIDADFTAILCFGPLFTRAAEKVNNDRVQSFSDLGQLARQLSNMLQPGDLVLFKGSRSAKMETVVEHIENQLNGGLS